jgi:HlyD family secretion protein
MSRTSKLAIAVLLIGAPLVIWLETQRPREQPASRERAESPPVLAAQGRVEGRDETISLGASADGVVKEVLVRDGQQVSKGALLAVIDCDDLRAGIGLAREQAESARQARIRLLRGHREEERRAAAQDTEAAKSILSQAQQHYERVKTLTQREISQDAIEQAKSEFEVAQANYEKAVQTEKLIDADPLPEEVARADADVAAAEHNVEVTADKLEKCNVRAPISGVILKVKTRIGEPYSTLLPRPLFTLSDDSVRRVRAEVDERDIGKVKLGQASVVTADGFPGRKFDGQIVQISRAMERKSVLSDDPAQKEDRDILDVVIELKKTTESLPIGLRVTAEMTSQIAPLSVSAAPSENISDPPAGSKLEKVSVDPSAEPPKLSGFALQVAAMNHKENADALAASLQKKNFPAFVFTSGSAPVYRVEVGPYADATRAHLAEEQLRKNGFAAVLKYGSWNPTR